MSATFYELLKYAKTGIASPEMTHYDKLKALAMCKGGFPVSTITGIPPLSFKSDGTPLTAWSISGAMTQSSVPSPSAPIQPQECGDKTTNLLNLDRTFSTTFALDETKWFIGAASNNNANVGATATVTKDKVTVTSTTAGYGACLIIPAFGQTEYVLSFDTDKTSSGSYAGYSFRDAEGNILAQSTLSSKSSKLTTYTNTAYIDICFRCPPADGAVEYSNIMLNTGSTAMPFEPFGYALPISCGGTTHTAYLPEPLRKIGDYADKVEQDGTVTRRVKKLVLTGEETFYQWDNGLVYLNHTAISDADRTDGAVTSCCSHFKSEANIHYASQLKNDGCAFRSKNVFFAMKPSTVQFADLAEFTQWVSQQYAAGTPVCVWYVLSTAQTETVTVPTLTPAKGANTLTVDTDLQPSEVSITGKIKSS